MKVKAQRRTDTVTSHEEASRIVDRNMSAINVFHRGTKKSLSRLRNRRLDLKQNSETRANGEGCQTQNRLIQRLLAGSQVESEFDFCIEQEFFSMLIATYRPRADDKLCELFRQKVNQNGLKIMRHLFHSWESVPQKTTWF